MNIKNLFNFDKCVLFCLETMLKITVFYGSGEWSLPWALVVNLEWLARGAGGMGAMSEKKGTGGGCSKLCRGDT